MSSGFVLFLGVGRLLIYIGQLFVHSNTKIEFINKLFACDLCLGVWVYTALSFAFKMIILKDAIPYFPFLSELMTGCACSFMMHLLVYGWKARFDVVVI